MHRREALLRFYPMRATATECLPDSDTFSPWFDLYFGASFCPDCFEGRVVRIDQEPLYRRGDAWAVAARAYALLGRPGEALRAWDRAQVYGGEEVDNLAIWLHADGRARAERRAERQADPGLRADSYCDLAAMYLSSRELTRAWSMIEEALQSCPTHGEARHWRRFLAMPDVVKASLRVQQRPSRRGDTVAVRDALALMPLRANGWVSAERLDRRALFDPPVAAVPGSALALLRTSGVPQSYLATEPDWARVPDRHPLLAAELELDELIALVHEGRPALALARSAWNGARGSGDAARTDDVGQLLCALGTQDPSIVEVAREAAEWLVETHERSQVLFAAYARWFAAVAGEAGAGAAASKLLGAGVADDLAWRLLVGAVFRAGDVAAARAELDRAVLDPKRRSLAMSLRHKAANPDAPVVALSPRLTRRELGMGRAVALA